ncbi:hypothetical protein TrLO_g4177 [Triparma laevis f. longispina]|nr:hypothetical protein TrLO_g4177 [Triparma laevis f. longispina]
MQLLRRPRHTPDKSSSSTSLPPPPSSSQNPDNRYGPKPTPPNPITILSLVKCVSLCCFFSIIIAVILALSLYTNIAPLVDLNNLPLEIDSDLGAWVLKYVKDGKLSGLMKETNDRIIIIQTSGGLVAKTLFDVSHSREAGYLIRRMGSRFNGRVGGPARVAGGFEEMFPTGNLEFGRVVVDIGANDGLLSSNSFNLASLGWSTVLVEPNPEQLALAKSNQDPYIDVYGEGDQKACYVQAAMTPSNQDGTAELFVTSDAAEMESHLIDVQTQGQRDRASNIRGGAAYKKERATIRVRTLSVESLSKKCSIPYRFGVLSIDAEGAGDHILKAWLENGFEPEYIIYEPMHNSGSQAKLMRKFLFEKGYR